MYHAVELGMGIHGEPGSDKQLLSQLDDSNLTHDLIAEVCTRLDTALQLKHELAPRCQGLAVMVNNLGAVSQSEMLIVCKGVSDFLYNANAPIMNGKVHQVRMYHGTFMTSLQMTGVSISCFMLPADDGFMEQMLHAPTMCCAWNVGFPLHAPEQRLVILRNPADVRRGVAVGASADVYDHAMSRELGGLASVYGPSVAPVGGAVSQSGLARLTEKYILSITAALQKHCDELGSLDRKTGDGDMGDTGASFAFLLKARVVGDL